VCVIVVDLREGTSKLLSARQIPLSDDDIRRLSCPNAMSCQLRELLNDALTDCGVCKLPLRMLHERRGWYPHRDAFDYGIDWKGDRVSSEPGESATSCVMAGMFRTIARAARLVTDILILLIKHDSHSTSDSFLCIVL